MNGPALFFSACAFITGAFLFSGCSEPYVKQPLSAGPDSLETGINATQAAIIQERLGTNGRSFSFAVTSDTHRNYEEFRRLLEHMSADTTLAFLLVCGDITDKGTLNEMREYHSVVQDAGLPFITTMGNREHYGTGRQNFETMFGGRNDQFVLGGLRVVLFDNVVTESTVPIAFDWLKTTLAAPHEGPTVVAMHIPPNDPSQLSPEHLGPLEEIIKEHKPDHVFMGHNHHYRDGAFPDGTPYTTVSWPVLGEYVKVTVKAGELDHGLVRVIPPASGDEGDSFRATAAPSPR